VRYFLLATHYRAPINYSDENVQQARAALERLYTALRGVRPEESVAEGEIEERFRAAMNDDFNTPEAFAVLQSVARELNTAKSSGREGEARALATRLIRLGGVLGLLQQNPESWFKQGAGISGAAPSDTQIEELIAARLAARTARNWTESDRIRDQLAAAGVLLEDGPKGTTWRRK
jgi:cysteinyl-tRNA synthetase